jgi:hypothetical protein
MIEKTEFHRFYVLWPNGATKLTRADKEHLQRTADLYARNMGAARAAWCFDGANGGRMCGYFDVIDANGEKVMRA